jgi:hypothetical protein
MTDDFGNPGPGLGQAQKCGRVKLDNGIPTLPFLITGSPMVIQVLTKDNKPVHKTPQQKWKNIKMLIPVDT